MDQSLKALCIDYKDFLTREIKNNNGIITTKQFVALGFNRQLLARYENELFLRRLQQGVYTLNELYEERDVDNLLMFRSQYLIFSHYSAIWQLGLSERPKKFYVTLPRNKSLPRSIGYRCEAFYVRPDFHELGMMETYNYIPVPVRYYKAERIICDFIRTNKRIGDKKTRMAVELCLSKGKVSNVRLKEYIEKFDIVEESKRYLPQSITGLL